MFRIGIVDHAHTGWQGGRNYVNNVVTALRGWEAAPIPFEVVMVPAVIQQRARLLRRIKNRLDKASGILDPNLHRQLTAHTVDFAYYCATGSVGRVGYHSAHWIPDFQSLVRPEFSDASYRKRNTRYIGNVMRDAQRVVLSSESSRRDCEATFPEYVAKTRVVPFRTASTLDVIADAPVSLDELRDHYELPERFFVVCNQFWAHKNHETVFRAAAALAEEAEPLCVVCTGEQRDLRDGESVYRARLQRLLEDRAVARSIRLVGKVSQSHLYSLMRHAQALIQPSFFEGWNTSVEEARCLGKTTLLSDIPVHREQASPFARYFDPREPASLAALMRQVLETGATGGWNGETERAAAEEYRKTVAEFARRFWDVAAAGARTTANG